VSVKNINGDLKAKDSSGIDVIPSTY